MASTKISRIWGGKIELIKIQSNPAYEAEYDRLDRQGLFTLDNINKMLERKIEPELHTKEITNIQDLTFNRLFDILDNMDTADLLILTRNIINNDYTLKIIYGLIYNRNIEIANQTKTR